MKNKHEHDFDFHSAENTGCGRDSVWVYGRCNCNATIKSEAKIRWNTLEQRLDGEIEEP